MLAAVISCFVVAILCPILCRRSWRLLPFVLALLPLALLIYFFSFSAAINQGDSFHQSLAWLPSMDIHLSFYLDGLSNLFALLISGVGIFIVLYSGSYLHQHPQLGRFYAYLFLFMGSMLGLVLADNLIILFVFWELTTLSSFLLISFDHQRLAARRAALQGLLVTAGGGLALLVGLVFIKSTSGSFSLSYLLTHPLQQSSWYTVIVILILLGAFTKSAQFPFHFWLPNAMQAPTPVSAYLHSATMVQAGIYLIARLTPVLGHTALWFYLLTVFGGLTMAVSILLALKSYDLKQMLAYSTTMALGLSCFLLASGKASMVNAAMLFFIAHAFYKAGLFLAAGNIEHATGSRDLRQLGGLARGMPITCIAVILCAASMAGLPPLVGFISKDLVYQAKLSLGSTGSVLLLLTFLTNLVFVLLALVVALNPFFRHKQNTPTTVHEAPFCQYLGVVVFAVMSLALGLFPSSIDSRFLYPAASAIANITTPEKLMLWHGWSWPLLLSVITIILALLLYTIYPRLSRWCQVARHLDTEKLSDYLAQAVVIITRRLTPIIQTGRLPHYLMISLLFIVITVAVVLFQAPLPIKQFFPHHMLWFESLLLTLILASGITITISANYIASLTCLSVIGICTALIFMDYGAPDVAMTQIVVDTLTIIIVVLALYRLPQLPKLQALPRMVALRNALVAIIVGSVVSLLLLSVVSAPFTDKITDFFASNAYTIAKGRNIVNVILVDFRALDTFGEVLVVALAGIGVYGLLKASKAKGGRS